MFSYFVKRFFSGLLICTVWLILPLLSAFFPNLGLSEKFLNLLILGFVITLIVKSFDILNNFKNHYSSHLFDTIITKVGLNFEIFNNKPKHLINWNISLHQSGHWRNTYGCIRCSKSINKNEFHWSNLGTSRPQKICLSCMKSNSLGGYEEEIKYADLYHTEFEKFLNKFKSINLLLDKSLVYNDSYIKDFFDRSIIKARRQF